MYSLDAFAEGATDEKIGKMVALGYLRKKAVSKKDAKKAADLGMCVSAGFTYFVTLKSNEQSSSLLTAAMYEVKTELDKMSAEEARLSPRCF